MSSKEHAMYDPGSDYVSHRENCTECTDGGREDGLCTEGELLLIAALREEDEREGGTK